MVFFCRLLLHNPEGMLKALDNIQQKSVKEKVKFWKQKIVVLGLVKIFSGVTAGNSNAVVPLLSQLLPWWLKVIEESELGSFEYAEDVHPDLDEEADREQWTEADRISGLYSRDVVSHTFMIDVIRKTLTDAAHKLNVPMESILQQVQNQTG